MLPRRRLRHSCIGYVLISPSTAGLSSLSQWPLYGFAVLEFQPKASANRIVAGAGASASTEHERGPNGGTAMTIRKCAAGFAAAVGLALGIVVTPAAA